MIKIYEKATMKNEDIFIRSTSSPDICDVVADIIYNVRKNGDCAIKEYAKRFDKCDLDSLEVTPEEIEEERMAKMEKKAQKKAKKLANK